MPSPISRGSTSEPSRPASGACRARTARSPPTTTARPPTTSPVVAGACSTLAGGSADGLAYPFDFPDPFVLPVGGTYFAYATNSVAGNIQIIESSDLTHWTAVGRRPPPASRLGHARMRPGHPPCSASAAPSSSTTQSGWPARVAARSASPMPPPPNPRGRSSTRRPARSSARRPSGAPSTRHRSSMSTARRTWCGSRTVAPVHRRSGPSRSIRPGPGSPRTPPRHSCSLPTSHGRGA